MKRGGTADSVETVYRFAFGNEAGFLFKDLGFLVYSDRWRVSFLSVIHSKAWNHFFCVY